MEFNFTFNLFLQIFDEILVNAVKGMTELITKNRFNMVYTCGPEKMMRKVFDIAEKNKVAVEASLERLMQ